MSPVSSSRFAPSESQGYIATLDNYVDECAGPAVAINETVSLFSFLTNIQKNR